MNSKYNLMARALPFNYNNPGSRRTSDCVCRAITIATGLPYQQVWDRLAAGNAGQRRSKHDKGGARKHTADKGICTSRQWFKDYMRELGFTWVATMGIGTGCRTHLAAGELPMGRIVCCVSKHYVAVIDGVINDTYDCSRSGTRCVYGYWRTTGEDRVAQCIAGI
jgi:hypothetical protein